LSALQLNMKNKHTSFPQGYSLCMSKYVTGNLHVIHGKFCNYPKRSFNFQRLIRETDRLLANLRSRYYSTESTAWSNSIL